MVADVDEREEQRRQEALKLYFEYFKHLTTLSVAGAVVMLAIYREGIAEQAGLSTSMGLFGLAVFIAVFGMLLVLSRFRFEAPVGEAPGTLMYVVNGLFGGGLLTFMYIALGIPLWVPLVVAPILLIAMMVIYRRLLQ